MTLLRPALLSLCLVLTAPGMTSAQPADALPDDIAAALSAQDYVTARTALTPLSAQDGQAWAQFRLGVLLVQGQGGPRDIEGGIALLEQALEGGTSAAGTLLARMFLTGQGAGVDRDPARAAGYLGPLAEEGVAEAQYYLALLHDSGAGVPQDAERALTLLRAAATQGHTDAQYDLSKRLSRGEESPEATAEAVRWLAAAAEGGHVEAQYFLAFALDTGNGIAPDKPAALNWYRRAAEGGMPIAQRTLGTKHLLGSDGAAQDAGEALRWLNAAAEAGDPGAMMNLALAYGGAGAVPVDDAAAATWLDRASEAGLGQASFLLGQYIETGRGMGAPDVKTAARYYRLAGEQGYQDGPVRLGTLVAEGALDGIVPPHMAVDWVVMAAAEGADAARGWLRTQADQDLRAAQAALGALLLDTDGDATRALPYLARAAETGDVPAQFRLATLYATGNGTALDYVQAHAWFNIAATRGHAEAGAQRDVLGKLMTPDQVSAAQAQVRTFFDTASDRIPAAARTQP
ncbi:SEL1-like repeat protein [Tateyamaria omphalii]|uniref:tetratricopeptide repeat protein n=1 Tax=Tateyamaria omphalii TaxID=299262 RepID=UPI001C9A07EB|nr:tetratricopeptide repeat protein [Tateyamaria omphalii]MBY5935566.1 SEL1-like repeat protein [Tateyamaria omphalii]